MLVAENENCVLASSRMFIINIVIFSEGEMLKDYVVIITEPVFLWHIKEPNINRVNTQHAKLNLTGV